MNLTLDKLFTVTMQKEDALLVIHSLFKSNSIKAKQIAQDLNERYQWNYKESAI